MLVENGSSAPRVNNILVLCLHCTFAMFKKLGIKANELKGLPAQVACHAPESLNQVIMAAILAKGEDKPISNFVGQVMLNASMKANNQKPLLFVYRVADPPESPNPMNPWCQAADIM
ncbi:hypothetical protein O181_132711 [Austropuccinia psidii MF-1]|uniref:Uncharacterized protein n=1 Tax=Austropuccinia psidii MF-1 TaxID=1389203 RepID=A0A9Q3L6C9_9BASI|nr:hypothetical protein [Austropuccinia psidii MF-1]